MRGRRGNEGEKGKQVFSCGREDDRDNDDDDDDDGDSAAFGSLSVWERSVRRGVSLFLL